MTAHTDANIKKLPVPAKGSRIYYDPNPAGFGVRVTAADVRSFVFTYRVRGTQRQRQMTVGRCANWSVGAARKEARRLKQIVDQGGDPLGDFEEQRAEPTMSDLIARFDEEHIERLRPQTAQHYRKLIKRHVRPSFGMHVKANAVKFEDVDQLHRRISKTAPYSANRTAAILSKMFALSIRWGMRDDNPARGIGRNYEQKRKRYLRGDELPRLIEALASHPNQQIANIVRLLLLTGARRGEVLAMRWSDVDLGDGVWTKPGSTTKQKVDHVTPLSAPAKLLLSEIRAAQIASGHPFEWVFPSDGSTGHVAYIDNSWAMVLKAADITGLRIHDLRHSFASQLASGGASLPLIGALLGHSNPATTSRYAHLYDDPMRKAVEKVGAVVAAAGKNAEATTVEAFPKGGRRGR